MSVFGIALRGLGLLGKTKKVSPTIKSLEPKLGQSDTINYKFKNLPKRIKAIYEAERLKRLKIND